MSDIINWLFAIIGAVGGAIAIWEFTLKAARPASLPSVSINTSSDEEQVVLKLKDNEKNKQGTLTNQVYQFVNAFNLEKENTRLFIYNPYGHYVVSRLKLMQFSLFGASGILMPLIILSMGNYNNSTYILMPLIAIGGLVSLYFAYKNYIKSGIVKDYMTFLKKNNIYVGYSMIQSKNRNSTKDIG